MPAIDPASPQSDTQGQDIRYSRFDEIYSLLVAFSMKHKNDLQQLNMDPEDFVQEVVKNIFTRRGLDNYDASKTRSFEALIFNIARRHLMDIRSKVYAKSRVDAAGRPYAFAASLDAPLQNKDGDDFTLGDLQSAPADVLIALNDLREMVPSAQISPNYKLTWAQLFDLSTEMEAAEIAQKVGISTSRIAQLQSELVSRFLRN